MMVPLTFAILLLFHWSNAGYLDENNQVTDNNDSGYLYPDDLSEDNDYDTRKRANNNFLRFGRSGSDYDDYAEDFARPTRSGKVEKNDHFIRFGRSKQDYLRFGRDSHRIQRANHLRFGRSVAETEDLTRNKRDTYSDENKRAGSNFLRFGRYNSNFMRFGRRNDMPNRPSTAAHDTLQKQATELLETVKQYPNSQLASLVMEYLENVRRQSDVV